MPWGAVDPMGLFGWGDAWRIYKDIMTSYGHSYVIIADTVTFGAIDPLHQYVEDLTEQYGDTYYYAREAAEISRDAFLAAGGLRAGGGLLNAGKKLLQQHLGAAAGLLMNLNVLFRGLTPAAAEALGTRAVQTWLAGNVLATQSASIYGSVIVGTGTYLISQSMSGPGYSQSFTSFQHRQIDFISPYPMQAYRVGLRQDPGPAGSWSSPVPSPNTLPEWLDRYTMPRPENDVIRITFEIPAGT